jgi:hypothetical protein
MKSHFSKSVFFSILVLWIFQSPYLFSQELKHQKKNLGSRTTKEFDVLKDNKDIKEGNYQLKIDNLVCQIGAYKSNQKSGIWQIYFTKDELELQYDYDKDELIYFNKKYYLNNDDSTLCRPIYLGGFNYFIQSIYNSIDPSQFQWGNGRLTVSFEVDPS